MHEEVAQFTFTTGEKRQLLDIARQAITAAVNREPLSELDLSALPPALRQPAACFVTLHIDGILRGCTGNLVAQRPVAEEVQLTAVQTAFEDPRFAPVSAREVPSLDIEISVLSPPQPLAYSSPDDLVDKLRPGIDGVILRRDIRRATFLPQVWERVPDTECFLEMLCQKMGLHPDAWRKGDMIVETYRVIAWSEAELSSN